MNSPLVTPNRRILVIDDNSAIHDDFRKILGAPEADDAELDAFETHLFGGPENDYYEIDSALQGDEGLRLVEKALTENHPYAVAFIDVRMPPGWDGIETTRRIWAVDPHIQVVICTAFSDYSWEDMQEQTSPGDRMLILKKPFEAIEVKQLAKALTEKWRLAREAHHMLNNLDGLVRQRTLQLEASEAAAREMMTEALSNREKIQQAYEELTRETTERMKLQEQFREQASLLDKARDAIIVRDLHHRILYWNRSAERIYGWAAEEAVGRPISELLYRDTDEFLPASQQVAAKGDWVGELHQKAKDGQQLTVESRWTLVHNSSGQPQSILEIATDITQQKKLEQQYLRAQRMESIGTLAGGIAHDLNNILTPILMSLDLLKMMVPGPRGHDILDVISRSASRGADLVNQVTTFARGMEGRRTKVQISEVIQDLEKIIGDTFPKNIKIQAVLAPNLRCLDADVTQLHQVLLNLCVNARDAMREGGRLTIQAENVTLDEHFAAANLEAKPGRYILVQVEDTGSGIPSSIIDSIFDPFFTTKEMGKGTGLGLATTLGIVKGHGGFLRVFSEPGKGTCFQIYLPALTDESAEAVRPAADLPETEMPLGHGQMILVVDDEEPIRQITRSTLESCGYRVMLAENGIHAVSIYAQHRLEIDAVLTDMMMPAMDGTATIKALMRINPAVRIIAASGINTAETANRVVQLGALMLLPKPYTAQTLLKAIHHALTPGTATAPLQPPATAALVA